MPAVMFYPEKFQITVKALTFMSKCQKWDLENHISYESISSFTFPYWMICCSFKSLTLT